MGLNIKGMLEELQAQVDQVKERFGQIETPSNLTDTQQSVLVSLIKRTMLDLSDLKANIISYQGSREE